MNKYEYRMTLGELTNTLQNWCHDGHANKPVELLIEQKGKRVYLSKPLLIEHSFPDQHCITLSIEDKTE